MSAEQDPVPEDLLDAFFTEAYQQLAVLEKNVLSLEKSPDCREYLDEIFRAAHNLKGAAATVHIAEIADLAHLLEDLLDAVRQSSLDVSRALVDALLEAVDIIKAMVEQRARGGIYSADSAALIQRLRSLLPEPAQESRNADKPDMRPPAPGPGSTRSAGLSDTGGEGKPLYRVQVAFAADGPMKTVGGVQVYTILKRAGRVVSTEPDLEALCGDEFFPGVTYTVETDKTESELAALCSLPDVTLGCTVSPSEPPQQSPQRLSPPRNQAYQPPLRVDSRRIDDLLSLANQAMNHRASLNRLSSQFEDSLQALRNTESHYRQALRQFNRTLPRYLEEFRKSGSSSAIREQIRTHFDRIADGVRSFEESLEEKNARFRHTAMSLGRITEEMQSSILRVRMVPLSQLFSRFPRLVRDLARSVEKQIKLVVSGEDTELDRSLIEDIQVPLVHCVRNAIDHGIEKPDVRTRSGKDAEGKITLDARAGGGEVVITVEDDGRGIDLERVRSRARERGLIGSEEDLGEDEIFELIFSPGFSTADTVTAISGRGVGLDVIRKQVEQLHGTVRLRSETGLGTCFTLRLPLSMAMMPVLLVRAGKEICAIPVVTVVESLTLQKTEMLTEGSRTALYFRGGRIPLLRPVFPFNVDSGEYRAYNYVVVLQEDTKLMGLVVDSLLGEEEIVIKPPDCAETTVEGAAGVALLADGSTALVLDINYLMRRART